MLKRFWKSKLSDYICGILIAVPLALVLRATFVQAYRVSSGSMEPTLQAGDFLFAWKLTAPMRDAVVIFHVPGSTDYIKRCVALAGDTVEVRNKDLYINRIFIPLPLSAFHSDPDTIRTQGYPRDFFGPYVVPANHFFVMGDNRDDSKDSRFIGAIPNGQFIGIAMFTYFSMDSTGVHDERMFRGL